MFRDDFVWGVASSAYQVEGTDAAGWKRKDCLGYIYRRGTGF